MSKNTRRDHSGFPRRGSPRAPQSNRNRSRPTFDPSLFIKEAVVPVPEAYTPTHAFADFSLCAQLKVNVARLGYKTPTPIQDQVIPHLIAGRDVVGVANTGTGKTAAFLLPLIEKVSNRRFEQVLIVAPTRELAEQINGAFKALAGGMGLLSVVCIGGVNIARQISDLRRNPNFVIGTPGRLKDLENRGVLRFSDYGSIVLDEVDRMLDMGFMPDVKYIVSRLPKKRQSLFFSATLPEKIREVAGDLLQDPVSVSIDPGRIPLNVDQAVIKINGRAKVDLLQDLLAREGFDKVLLFGRTKWGIEKLVKFLQARGFHAASIHSNKSQNQRQRALAEFKDNRVQILLATDLAARGLDIDNVTHVINYDLPESYEAYLHRIGRTGRADKKGKALTFVD